MLAAAHSTRHRRERSERSVGARRRVPLCRPGRSGVRAATSRQDDRRSRTSPPGRRQLVRLEGCRAGCSRRAAPRVRSWCFPRWISSPLDPSRRALVLPLCLPEALEEAGQSLLLGTEALLPEAQQPPAVVSQLTGVLAAPETGGPPRSDRALLLQLRDGPVDAREVGRQVGQREDRGQPLGQFVAMTGALGQQEQQAGLDVAVDPSSAASTPAAAVRLTSHSQTICDLRINSPCLAGTTDYEKGVRYGLEVVRVLLMPGA